MNVIGRPLPFHLHLILGYYGVLIRSSVSLQRLATHESNRYIDPIFI